MSIKYFILKTKQNKVKQNKAKQNKTKQNKTKQKGRLPHVPICVDVT